MALPASGGAGEPAGDPELVADVAREEGVSPDEVVLTAGAGEADGLATFVVAGGATVVVEAPTYPPLREVARLAAARVVRVARSVEDAWRLDVDAVEAELRPGTALVVVTSPNNPTGSVVPDADLRRLADACGRVGAWLLVDEIFRRLGGAARSARTVHPRILATGSLTKAEGLGGLRFGWLLAPPEVARAALALKLATSGPVPTATQAFARAALRARAALLARSEGIRRTNLATIRHDLDAAPRWVAPDAGVATVVPVRGQDEAFAKAALTQDGVLVVPGTHVEAPGFVRVGFGLEPERFAAGWKLLRRRL
ncbi:MAG TPA: pyridoxal phosphate-dependent aminotransferase [Candidatus Thermoplasmatota archaeon]|nr:pyridoxal phosphate-dependent aminotransferase [Candidatus Thermoplasmatota archaeon]